MSKPTVAQLEKQAIELRKIALTMIYKAQSGHPGGSFSAADIITALYFREMNIRPDEPKWPDRDRFVLSKGHVAPIVYAALAVKGFVPMETVDTLRKKGSPFQGHPDSKKCPGIDISTGSLGQGVSCAVGMALAGKRDGKDYRVFTMAGDGESQEGLFKEAMQSAGGFGLDNYIVILDNNGLQLDGRTEDVMPGLNFSAKFVDYGFDNFEIDGHDMQQIVDTFDEIRNMKPNGKPKSIVANTIKGRGVSFMEDQLGWHGMAPNDEQFAQAMAELEEGLK